MKKVNHDKEKRLQSKRERKREKRKGKKYIDRDFGVSVSERELRVKVDVDQKLIDKYTFDFDEFLDANSTIKDVKVGSGLITFPSDFSLETNQKGVFYKIKEIRKTLMLLSGGEMTLDFSKCNKVDFSSLFLLRTILSEYLSALNKLDSRLSVLRTKPRVKVVDSSAVNVSMQLLACSLIHSPKANVKEPDLMPITALRYRKGSKKQRNYSENKKGMVASDMRRYVNDCLNEHDTMLTPQEESDFDGIISETLNNAEDHSPFDTWYAFGNFFKSNKGNDEEFVGEVNLAIMNFGYSIYDGIMETKDQNPDQFKDIQAIHDAVKSKDKRGNFTTENLFTLSSLQEGISRLKHEDESRGTGTMTFIQSFMEVGDYESKKDGFHPSLMIYSGNTVVKCEPKYRPFSKDDRFFISLNSSRNIADLPDKNNLWASKRRFPGTLLVVKMYLNKKHLHKKIENGG